MNEDDYKKVIENLTNQREHDKTLIEQLGIRIEEQQKTIITLFTMILDRIKR